MSKINWTIVEQLKALDQAFEEVLAIYEKTVPEKLQTLENAIRARETQKSLVAVHTVLSSSSYLGGLEIKKVGEQLRVSVEAADWNRAEALFLNLKSECYELISVLKS